MKKLYLSILSLFFTMALFSVDDFQQYFELPQEIRDALYTLSSWNILAWDTDTFFELCPSHAPDVPVPNGPTAFARTMELLDEGLEVASYTAITMVLFEVLEQFWRIPEIVEEEIWLPLFHLFQQYVLDMMNGKYGVPMMSRMVREDAPVIPQDEMVPDALETIRDIQLRTLVITGTVVPWSAVTNVSKSIILRGNPLQSCIVFKEANGFLKGKVCSNPTYHLQGLYVTNNGTTECLQLTPSGNTAVNGTLSLPASGVIMLDNNSFVHVTGNNSTFIGSQAGNFVVTGSDNTAYGAQALHNTTTGFANTAVGAQALFHNTTGSNNTAVGTEALYANVSGNNNSAAGYQALYSNISGGDNTAVGMSALFSMTGGSRNTAIGYEALYMNQGSDNTAAGAYSLHDNVSGSFNTACGYKALQHNISGSENSALGAFALNSNLTGSGNTAVGFNALFSNISGSSNSALGYEALRENTTANNNTALGMWALRDTTTGSDNTALGTFALQSNISGSANCAMGYAALRNSLHASGCVAVGTSALANSTGNNNTAIGASALQNTTTGINNTALGTFAGASNTTGSNNTFIGYRADCSAGNLNNSTALGANAIVTTSNTVVIGDSRVIAVIPGVDNVCTLGTATNRWKDIWAQSIIVPSDERYKKNMKGLSPEQSLQFIDSLEPLSYTLGDQMQFGLSAQQVEQALDQLQIEDFGGLVYTPEADLYGLCYSEFIPSLIGAIQALADEVDFLQISSREYHEA